VRQQVFSATCIPSSRKAVSTHPTAASSSSEQQPRARWTHACCVVRDVMVMVLVAALIMGQAMHMSHAFGMCASTCVAGVVHFRRYVQDTVEAHLLCAWTLVCCWAVGGSHHQL
jgi:hypothetical protein